MNAFKFCLRSAFPCLLRRKILELIELTQNLMTLSILKQLSEQTVGNYATQSVTNFSAKRNNFFCAKCYKAKCNK